MLLKNWAASLKSDLPASVVVFFVALPLCLGIALASGAPLFSGVIAGIVGGIVVGAASGSALGVSGPAAGLAVIVLTAIQALGSYPAFLTAVIIGGAIQILLGYLRAGFIAFFFPSSVIKGMLSGIGVVIILKQLPYAIGYSQGAFNGAVLSIGLICLTLLVIWDQLLTPRFKIFSIINGPLVAVATGIGLHLLFSTLGGVWALGGDQLVRLPVADSWQSFLGFFTLPSWSEFLNPLVWKTGLVLAIIASLETLLCVEATDKLDPQKRVTPTNRELKAQGLGNVVSGLLGGLPVTQVIVRSSANINFGAQSKVSAIVHGLLLLVCAITLPTVLNLIPLASLAAILLVVGYKLVKPALFKQTYRLGWEQFAPFATTIVMIVVTDLLTGILVGLGVSAVFVLYHSYRNTYHMKDVVQNELGQEVHHLVLAEEVSFFNKAAVVKAFAQIPANSKVIIDCSRSKSISYDVVELIKDFESNAQYRNITVEKIQFIEPQTHKKEPRNAHSFQRYAVEINAAAGFPNPQRG